MKEYITGGKAEGMDCEAIAKKHGVDVSIIKKQVDKGIKIEHEHSADDNIAAEISRDHLVEHPYYYDFLEKMETEFKKDYSAKGYGKKKKEKSDSSPEVSATLKRLFG